MVSSGYILSGSCDGALDSDGACCGRELWQGRTIKQLVEDSLNG